MSWYSPLLAPLKLFNRSLAYKNDPTYAYMSQFLPVGQPIWSSRDARTFTSKGYRACGTVYTCINKISNAAAGIQWKLYTDRSCQREITAHPLLDLWNRPNNRMGGSFFVEQLFGYWHIAGNAYIYANRPNSNEPPVELWPLRPDLTRITAGDSDIAGYTYGWGTSKVQNFTPEQIMHIRFASYDDEIYGLSPIEVAMMLVDQQTYGNAWNTAVMQNEGRPSAVVKIKNYLTVEQRTQIRQELQRRYSGKRNAGMPMVLEADADIQVLSLSSKELDWIKSRELNTRDIAAIFDVAPELVGDSAGKTFANQKEAKQSLYTENVLPKLDRVVGNVNGWLVPMYADLAKMGAWFTYDKQDIEVLAELYTAAQQAISTQATSLWETGQADLYAVQKLQGIKPDPNAKGIYRIGQILVRSEDLQAYAQQALQKPVGPPALIPEPMLNQPGQLPAPKPTTTVTEVPNNDENVQNPPQNGDKRRIISPQFKVLDLTTHEEKKAYMQQVEARRAKWEDDVEKRVQSYFGDEQKVMAKAIAGCSTDSEVEDAVETVLTSQHDDLQQLVYNIWHDVADDFGKETAKQLAEAKADLASIFNQKTIAYLLNLSAQKVQQITDTTRDEIRQELANGVAAGESIRELAKRIDGLYLQQIIPNRSTNLAQTECVAASNWASHTSAEGSGLTLEKVWLATEDSHTRPAHANADGQTVPLNESFTVGDDQMMYPGDNSASASNVCRCRCSLYYQRVKAQPDDDEEDDNLKIITLPPRRRVSPYRLFQEAYAR